jgi:hypothetical protein
VDFTTLKQEFADRGFSRLSASRQGFYVNEGRRRLDNLALWPYRLASASGASPLTITDLGTIEEVANSAVTGSPSLDYADRRSLRDSYGDLTITGSPSFFYVDNGVVRTYPVGGTLAVRYYKRPPQLSAGADTPLAPVDYHMLYVDYAEDEAHAGKSDWQGASALAQRIQVKTAEMVSDLLGGQQIVGSDLAPVSGESCDW